MSRLPEPGSSDVEQRLSYSDPSQLTISSPEDDPARPVKYAHAAPEGDDLEQWKTSVLPMIDKRIDLYPLPPRKRIPTKFYRTVLFLLARMKQLWRSLLRLLRSRVPSATPGTALKKGQQAVPLDPDHVVTAIEKVGHIPELVENIIRFADAETQTRVAWKVSSLWRHTVAHVIMTSNSFLQPYAGKAVERGSSQDVDATPGLPEPSEEDFQKFEHELLLLRGLQHPSDAAQNRESCMIYPPYWPAHICASRAIPDGPDRQRVLLNEVEGPPFWFLRDTNIWHEFTQFKMNPYFQTVFSRQLSGFVGVYEVELQSLHRSNNLIFGTSTRSQTFVDLLGSMQLTQPPCKAIELSVQLPFQHPGTIDSGGLKHPVQSTEDTTSAVHVLNENGITCAELFDALEKCAESVMIHWRSAAIEFRKHALELEEYTDGIWRLRGKPTILIVLSNSFRYERKSTHGYLQMPSVVERQLEWIPMELVRTMDHSYCNGLSPRSHD